MAPTTDRGDRSLDLPEGNPMADHDAPDPAHDRLTSRLLRREALRRATEELSTTTSPGLEQALARVSAEVTEEAAYRRAKTDSADAAPGSKRPEQM
jgi:hypothetical protein